MTNPKSAVATVWTRRLQWLTVACSVVLTIGTTLQNFVIVDAEMLSHSMRLAGLSAAEADAESAGFLVGFRVVGCAFIVGNALGLLALRGDTWVFWLVVAVNAGQAAGVVAVPPEVFRASIDLYGPAGILPTVVTDGGALLLLVTLLVSLVVFRAPWARRRVEVPRPS
ncbi:hypothetical protein J4H86_17960 [Spiractinospora alimapuensis]|uniref:hypothetical protein n=1 Tax=Spiractinospora alimapuensis TaxID=2820884 RepID=UPI001F39DBED|nr:hypothetical protein [Spiractinospora alimapuensis]QVQ50753.1 hypothetical protein J4H86_17960 [Spiractinospora alimapuensis]